MNAARDKSRDKSGGKGGGDSRKERLARALRANLKRRKQAGGRAAPRKDKKTGGGDTPG